LWTVSDRENVIATKARLEREKREKTSSGTGDHRGRKDPFGVCMSRWCRSQTGDCKLTRLMRRYFGVLLEAKQCG
jgi:hypothetical protein